MLDAGVNYNGAGDDYLDYWLHSELLPMPLADPLGFECGGNESFIPQGQDSFVTGGPYLGGQYSITEQNHSLSLSDAEKLRFLDPEMTTWPNEASFDECFDSAQATPVFSNEVAVVGYTNPLLFPPAGMVGTTQVPAELPPVDVNNLGTQRSSTRKQPASQDYRHEGERTKYNSAAREQTQVSPAGIVGPTQKGILTAIVLDDPGCHTLVHAPVSLYRETGHVQIAKCAERLATSAFDRFHGPGGREKAGRDQSPRRLEQAL